MIDYGVYQPQQLSSEEVSHLEKLMSDSFQVLRGCAAKFYKFEDVKRLRNEYRTGKIDLSSSPDAKQTLDLLQQNETRIISGFIKLAVQFIKRFNVDMSEGLQESANIIYNSMYTYTGADRFSTYVSSCIRNRRIDLFRSEDRRRTDSLDMTISSVKMNGQAPNHSIKMQVPDHSIKMDDIEEM